MTENALFQPCGCSTGDLYGPTDECLYCKGTGKLLTTLGHQFYELIEWSKACDAFDQDNKK